MNYTYEVLDTLSNQSATELTSEIKTSLENIQSICNSKYFNQRYYGHAALNRKMLLDAEIAALLTPEVLTYIFTNQPTDLTKINRNSTPGGIILQNAIYHGFKDGLHIIHRMPNNDKEYGPQAYERQKSNFTNYICTCYFIKCIFSGNYF